MLDESSTTRPLTDTNVLCKFMYLFSTVNNLGTNCILLLICLLLTYINIVACNVGRATRCVKKQNNIFNVYYLCLSDKVDLICII